MESTENRDFLTNGGKANLEYIESRKNELLSEVPAGDKLREFMTQIPDPCLNCSAAWDRVYKDQSHRLKGCQGREEHSFESAEMIDGEEVVRSYIVGRCRLGSKSLPEK